MKYKIIIIPDKDGTGMDMEIDTDKFALIYEKGEDTDIVGEWDDKIDSLLEMK